jgi:prepilin-type N-terminal cleavage/methylation domain-containing protein
MESRDIIQATDRRAGFTLVELLVVVAILAVLIALLLPALGRARYVAKNTLCAANQRQIAIGAISYAAGNADYYPAAKDPRYDDSPHFVVRYDSSGNVIKDYRKDLIDYFGGSVRRAWTCPLAKADWDGKGGWQTGGGYDGNWPRYLDDLNSTRQMAISYAFFFGVADGEIGGPSFKPAIGVQGFTPTKPMRRGGDPFVAGEWHSGEDQEYRVLSSDVNCMDGLSWVYAHQAYRQGDGLRARNTNFSALLNGNTPGVMVSDINYALNDGSVHTLWGVTAEDPRITAARNGGVWGWAWILPNPLTH